MSDQPLTYAWWETQFVDELSRLWEERGGRLPLTFLSETDELWLWGTYYAGIKPSMAARIYFDVKDAIERK